MRIGELKTDLDIRSSRHEARSEESAGVAKDNAPKASPPARQPAAAGPDELRKIESVTRQIDTFLRSINRSLQFRVDDASGRLVVSLRDSETGEVIRQVPGEEALRIAERIESGLAALLDEKI